jgi:hypothetical protein
MDLLPILVIVAVVVFCAIVIIRGSTRTGNGRGDGTVLDGRDGAADGGGGD